MKNTDVYSKIKVSDSEPIDERHLAIYQKIDINKSENQCLYIENV